jgi:hypothetical protein
LFDMRLSKPEECRRLAVECLDLADQLSGELRTRMLDMAAAWHRLALDFEQQESSGEGEADPFESKQA